LGDFTRAKKETNTGIAKVEENDREGDLLPARK
jgi:hypothetical protein